MQNSKLVISFLALWLVSSLSSCDLVQVKNESVGEQSAQKPVARVNNTYLYATDLEGIVTIGSSLTDSSDRVDRYINNWIRKQLLIDEAKAKIEINEADIQRKILDYQYSLIAYQYQSFYINQHLNTVVTEEEIASYYQSNQDNFPLKQNIIRGSYVKVLKKAPNVKNLKKLIRSTKDQDKETLQEFCFKYAANFTLEDSIWINYDDLVKGSPFAETANTVQFLRDRNYSEASDSIYNYYLKIAEYKKTDDIAPIGVVKDQIIDIIINKRKITLAKNLEKEVYNEAVKQNTFEIFK